MALKFFKLYGYGFVVVLLCLGVYVGAFIVEVKHKSTEQAQIEPQKAQEQEKNTEQAKEAQKALAPIKGVESKEEVVPKSETRALENKEASKEVKETKATENKEVQETPVKEAQKPAEQSTKEQSTSGQEPPYTLYQVGVSAINVRSKPSTHAPVVAKILRGQEVRVLKVKEGWGRVEKGWVYLPLLKKEP
ncbi:SH3 domain-containing protein [Helicobacter heilmannii]|uniref:Uncharacterized protein n=1 Tax=Helicobacter heilmannii TaxID=35817 RepID=A0A0K2XSP9_HELHE|nr:SH3 domain-containing protein [Helicobacter heilmannii]CCM11364.1 hypothetical protein BN341_13990 [Helicobacter heilmannii ASB1.4]CRF49142.1 hypothetical protein HHE03_07390 [Helicobacter heilmannii]CRF51090.1 hypothetical protein HHE06_09490 [Helicobacter heilmannii]CRI34784.1 hypothetical protein HHE01_05850 [Helicobacter heilmannii]BDQ26378.1 hypothetical protein ASB1_00540 [Helicobacter heilmannii]